MTIDSPDKTPVRVHKKVWETDAYLRRLAKLNKQLVQKFKGQYLLHKAFYIDHNTEIKVCCKSHGFFWVKPKDLIATKFPGCPTCVEKYNGNTYRYNGILYTKKSFMEACTAANGEIFDYSNTNFKGFKRSIKAVCKVHGTMTIYSPHIHLTPTACPACKGSLSRNTTEDFIAKAKDLHGEQYLYNNSIYISCREPVVVTCRIHGPFKVPKAADHYSNGTGCPKCNKGGFDSNLPGIVYYLSVFDGMAYKIGITNNTVKARFGSDMKNIKVLKTWYFENGREARNMERRVLTEFANYKYTASPLLATGNTELFYRDILDLDDSLQ